MNIINSAEEIVENFNLHELDAIGITKSLETTFWPGHTIVTYPFYDEIKETTEVDKVLEKIKKNKFSNFSLYIHIPYCTDICNYCAYSKSATGNVKRKEGYIDFLSKEMDLWIDFYSLKKIPITSLYLGGGTPTSLPLDLFSKLLNNISNRISKPENFVEITCEASPETIFNEGGEEKLDILMESGFNRISIGIQSFSDQICENIIGRRHNGEGAVKAIEIAFKAGFQNLNIDLMYGLPTQSFESWLESLKKAIDLGVPSITIYPFKIKRLSIWAKQYKNSTNEFEWSPERALIFATIAKQFLELNGYTQSSVYWYTKNAVGKFEQQNEKYSMHNLLGIGCSTYSFVSECQFFNIYTESNYIKKVDKGLLPLEIGKRLNRRELMKRFLIFGFKKSFSADEFYQRYGADAIDEFPVLKMLIEKQLISYFECVFSFTELGNLFADEIGVLLDQS